MNQQRMAYCILMIVCLLAATALGQHATGPTAGKPLSAQWKYSKDGGKTFTVEAPVAEKAAVTACATFVIDDLAKVGAVKLMTASPDGGFALTDIESIQRRYVGAKPVVLNTRLTVNEKATDAGCFPDRLYRFVTVDPSLLKRGENRLTLSGLYWLPGGQSATGAMKLEALPPDLAVLDHEPVLGVIGADFFSFTARAIIPCQYELTVKPLEPPGEAQLHAMKDKVRLLRWKVPLPAGTKKFSYALTARPSGGAKTYGPYEVTLPTFGEGFRFIVAANTANYRHDMGGLKRFVRRMREENPQILVLGGMLQNCPNWDFMWAEEFFPLCKDFLARTPTYLSAGYKDLYSAAAYSQDFYFPTADGVFDNWTQVIGKVRLVAVEAFSMSQDGGKGLKWLDEVLAGAKEDYVLVLNCHVSHCSGGNAQPYFRPGIEYTTAQIDPLLVKHKVTATIGSYHYVYERSEPPASEGVPTIMTARAGGFAWPLRGDMLAANKSSKVAVGKEHYCVFEVKKDRLVMQAVDFDGKVFDTREFPPRKM